MRHYSCTVWYLFFVVGGESKKYYVWGLMMEGGMFCESERGPRREVRCEMR